MFGECHAHIFMNGRNYREAVDLHKNHVCEADIRRQFEEYKKRGITFVRDGGDRLGVSDYARAIAPEYGIDYRTPLFAIHKKGHYGGIVGFPWETMSDYENLIKKVKNTNGDFIKIMISGIMDFNKCGILSEEPLPPGEIRELIDRAHDAGYAVMAHANGSETVTAAAEAGVDSIEHGNYIDQESILAMKEHDVVWVPTMATIHNLEHADRFPKQEIEAIMDLAVTNVEYAWENGVTLALGSDAGAYLVPHGKGLLDEYDIFCKLFGKTEELNRRLTAGEQTVSRRFKAIG